MAIERIVKLGFSFALFTLIINAQAEDAPGMATDLSAQKVFSRVQPYVFKVKTSPTAESPQASYGTGFVVDGSGLLITNYHVISESLVEPKKNKIFVMVNDQPIAGEVLAVNVVQDLSLIRVKKTFSKALSFAKRAPEQGTSIYAIGQPEDLNMAIVAGTYNGEISYGKYKIIHLSAPINSGMSGGPTVNSAGELIGVNVSKYVGASNLSFSVPAVFAQELYESSKNLPAAPVNQWSEMEKQLLALQDSLSAEILAAQKEKKSFHHWQIPSTAKGLKCWSVNDHHTPEEKTGYDSFQEQCSLQHSSFLSSDEHSGTYALTIRDFSNKDLNSWQFFNLLSNSVWDLGYRSRGWWATDDDPKLTTKGECFSDIVVNRSNITFKASYCSRAYTYFPKLRDARLLLTTVNNRSSAFSLYIDLSGFSLENTKLIFTCLIENITLETP